jgi:NADH-quinone oxidoreductase subunit C
MGVESQTDKANPVPSPLELLKERFPDGIIETSMAQGDAAVIVRPEILVKAMEFLKSDPRLAFNMLADLTAVDYAGRSPRFDVVYNLLSTVKQTRLRVKVQVDSPEPMVDSLTPLWGSANWLEREVWDMFGIRFAGHPNLKRILLYEEFQGHPLRKDYPIRRRQPLIGPKN